jgi:hypothetical protein
MFLFLTNHTTWIYSAIRDQKLQLVHFSDQCFHIGLQHLSSDDVCAAMKKNFSPQGFLLFSVFGTR